MIEDGFDRPDVENAILQGAIRHQLTRDLRGARYRVAGPATDGRLMQVICRFREAGSLVIITVYEPEQEE